MAALDMPSLWAAAKQMAIFQGRFYQLITYPLAMLPYVAENLTVTNLFRIYTFLIFFAGFIALCRELFGWRGATCCAALFLCLFDTVGGPYNAFHGLPLWFGVGYGLLLFSLSMHVRALRNGKSSLPAFSLFGISLLTYEIVILYAPVFIFSTLFYQTRRSSDVRLFARKSILSALRSNIPAMLFCCIYLIVYIVFRHYYPGTYTGAEGLTLAAPESIAKPIFEFSWHSLYWHFSAIGNQALSVTGLLFAVASVLAIFLSLVSNTTPPAARTPQYAASSMAAAIIFIAAYIFVPNILFGFTGRYRIWAGDGVKVYLGSALSAVAFVILLYILSNWLWRVLRRSMIGRLLGTALLFSVFVISYANAKNAENFYSQSAEMSIRWPVANWASDKLKGLPTVGVPLPFKLCESGFTHTSELHTYFRNPDMMADVDIFWNHYFSRETGRAVEIVNDPTNSVSACDARLQLSYLQHSATLSVPSTQHYWHYTWR